MKLKKIIYTIPLAVIMIAVGSGCRKSQFNINKNINDPTDSTVTYDVVLPAALHASGSIIASQWGVIQNWMGFWARSGTYAPAVTEETYQITTTFGNGIWNAAYDNNYDYNIIQSKAHAAGAGMYEGIARIMKAHNFMILVDVYGNVPYSQALKGSSNATPGYDNGLDIYKDLLRQIDTGIALIKAAPTPTGVGPDHDIWRNDIMFGNPGNTGAGAVPTQKLNWARFGNSLKLKMLIHTSGVAAIDKAAEIAKIVTEGSGYIETDARINPGYKTDKPMPFYGSYFKNGAGTTVANFVYYAANKWGIEYYTYNGDPRIARFYTSGTSGFKGVEYGRPPESAYASGVIGAIGAGLYKSPDSAQMVLSASEVWYLRAEARIRGYITSGPTVTEMIRNGTVSSFNYLGLTTVQADSYLTGNAGYPDVDVNASTAFTGFAGGLATVLHQKWFSLNGIDPLEVWNDYRRVPFSSIYGTGNTTHFVYGTISGYPAGPPISISPQLPPGAQIPLRYLYPQTEYNYNPANVAGQGSVTPQSRVFWDVN